MEFRDEVEALLADAVRRLRPYGSEFLVRVRPTLQGGTYLKADGRRFREVSRQRCWKIARMWDHGRSEQDRSEQHSSDHGSSDHRRSDRTAPDHRGADGRESGRRERGLREADGRPAGGWRDSPVLLLANGTAARFLLDDDVTPRREGVYLSSSDPLPLSGATLAEGPDSDLMPLLRRRLGEAVARYEREASDGP